MMQKKQWIIAGGLSIALALMGIALAHTPLCTCYDNGDGTITCEGAFSDGSSAAGVEMRVVSKDGKVLANGKMNEDSEFSFETPKTPYRVEMNAGPGHNVEIDGDSITE